MQIYAPIGRNALADSVIGPDKRDSRHVGIERKPDDDKPGGLKGSMQHLLAVYPQEFEIPTFFVAVD